MSNEELIKLIERLGDDLGEIIELSESIFNTTKKRFQKKQALVDIWQFHNALTRIEVYYTKFHTHIFKELEKK